MEKIKSQKKKKPGPLIPNLEKTIYTISLIIQTIVEEVIPLWFGNFSERGRGIGRR